MGKHRQGIVVLGSTGSIGISTLAVIRENPEMFRIDGLSCNNNIEVLADQIREFSPEVVSVRADKADHLRELIQGFSKDLTILKGNEGQVQLAEHPTSSKIVAAVVGAIGIEPVLAGIRSKKTIALANKESLVLAGSLIMTEAEKFSVKILPIDSEHNAIFQSLQNDRLKDLDHITLTASGGPFREKPLTEFKNIELKEALKHPNWRMGEKITIDSATMMNKCLEIIEAKWLFRLKAEQIKVLIHPQSIIHSMVTFKDASTICQMGVPDMKIPIANCLGYPHRINSGSQFLDLSMVKQLTFQTPDTRKFPTIQMAYDVLKLGEGAPAALNGANEVLVDHFLRGKLPFLRIFELLQELLYALKSDHQNPDSGKTDFLENVNDLSSALKADNWGREFINGQIQTLTNH